ncbi:MAG TPA: hypothetical protein VGN15_06270 [Ktedonobacteraceae bacterium]|jgi:hypothetical protein|nr:hypothetical protein [Ktedonobacteraceae bacterium]
MLNIDDIVLALKDAGLVLSGNESIVEEIATGLQELSQVSGVKTGHALLELLNQHNNTALPYCFYIAEHESEKDKMVTYSLDYPEVTAVIANNAKELIRVGQEIIYSAHAQLMAAGALIRQPMQKSDDRFPDTAFTRIALGDLYALRIFQHNLRVVCAHLHIEPSLDLDPEQNVYLH